jgi:protein-L-isoaspartate(D-aspartate) O-methyltransferase
MKTLAEHRRFYAEHVVQLAGSSDRRLIAAFAAVPREDYLGPGPWLVAAEGGYLQTPDDDPRPLYHDVLVAIAPERGINNGQPSLHAHCMAEVAPAPGEKLLHIGAGTGYYTAILATLVGPRGRVIGLECEPDLAARARANLRGFANVEIRAESATEGALPRCDVIYVSAGAWCSRSRRTTAGA